MEARLRSQEDVSANLAFSHASMEAKLRAQDEIIALILSRRDDEIAASSRAQDSRRSLLTGAVPVATKIAGSSVSTNLIEAHTMNVTGDAYFFGSSYYCHDGPSSCQLWTPREPTMPPSPSPSMQPTLVPTPQPTQERVIYDTPASSGWSPSTSQCTGVHGPFDRNVGTVIKTFDLSATPHKSLRLVTTVIGFETMDPPTDYIQLSLDGNEAYTAYPPLTYTGDASEAQACVDSASTQLYKAANLASFASTTPRWISSSEMLTSFCPWASTAVRHPSATSGAMACAYGVDLTIAHTAPTLVVRFTSGTDQNMPDEAWGFGDIELHIGA